MFVEAAALIPQLAHIHQKRVIHRDVKTGNVLLQFDESGSLTIAKVSDFGTVRVNKETQENALATSVKTHASTKQVCGTGPYMPPGRCGERSLAHTRAACFR